MNTPSFIMMVGVPGCGKSTIAEELKVSYDMGDVKCVILSSDKLREELYGDVNDQEHNGEVFNEMQKRTQEYLQAGVNVIYDATNISSKKRANFLKHQIGDIACTKMCIYMATPWEKSIENDSKRERTVGKEVINRMKYQMQIPMMHEGWDNIRIIGERPYANLRGFIFGDVIRSYNDYIKFLDKSDITKPSIEFDQNNPHHVHTLSKHMYNAYKTLEQYHSMPLEFAGMLHDIGKPYCQTNDEDGVSHYYSHDGLSAQLAIRFLLENHNFPDSVIIHIATLIQLHMRMFDLAGLPKLKGQVGQALFRELELFNMADSKASQE